MKPSKQVEILGAGGAINGSVSRLKVTTNPSWQESGEDGKWVSGHHRQTLELTVKLPVESATARQRKNFYQTVVNQAVSIKRNGFRFAGYTNSATWEEDFDDVGATSSVRVHMTIFGEEQ